MHIDKILNTIRLQASLNANEVAHLRLGIVTSYNPDGPSVKVRLQPEDSNNPSLSLTGELPLSSLFVGDGWGLVAAPSIGDWVLVNFLEGSYNSGFVIGVVWQKGKRSPQVPSGEFWLVHKSGSFLKFTNDGNVSINAKTVNVKADTINLGDSNLHALMTDALIEKFNNHVHSNSDPNTGPPTTQLSKSDATSAVKAK